MFEISKRVVLFHLIFLLEFHQKNKKFFRKKLRQNKDRDLDENENNTENYTLPNSERKLAHSFPAGTQAGNFFHEIFENIDFSEKEHEK